MKKKLPMKGDPTPDWLRSKPLCPCSNPGSREINGKWFCEMCFQAGTEDWHLLNPNLKARSFIYE